MTAHRLDPLFRFSSVAVIGASESAGYGNAPHAVLRNFGYAGRYVPVNAAKTEVHGIRAYASIRDVPDPVEVALLAIRRDNVPGVLRDCAASGVRAAVVITAGFAESGPDGARLQDEIAEIARETGLAVLGPNCLGVASVANGCAAFASSLPQGLAAGNVAVVSNSGGLLNEIVTYGNARGIGFSHVVSSGNEAAVSAAELLDFFVRDPATDVVLALLESVRDPTLFVEVADRAAQSRKPLVVLKIGASEKGTRAALTHTGALAGSDDAYAALFRQKGVIRVADVDELVEVGALLSNAIGVLRARPIERAAIVEISGGGKALVCDMAAAAGVELPDPSEASSAALRGTLAERIEPSNPLDTGSAWSRAEMATLFPLALRTFAAQPDVDAVVARFTVPREGPLGPLAERVAELEAVRAAHPDRLFAVLSRTSDRFSDEWLAVLRRARLPFLQGYGRGLRALGALASYSRFVWGDRARDGREPPGADPSGGMPRWTAAPPTSASRAAEVTAATTPSATSNAAVPTTVLDQLEALELVASAGIAVASARRATSADEAVAAAAQVGLPVALKVISPDIIHKSDAGGVRLGLDDERSVRAAFAAIEAATDRAEAATDRAAATARATAATTPTGRSSFRGVVVQRMAPPGGVEVVIGAHRDAQLGPVVLFGLGGVFVEVLRDVALRVAPVSERDAAAMLDEIRGAAVLDGARGGSAVDRVALVRAIRALADLMIARADIASLDLNPVIAYPSGLLAVDARIAIGAQ